MKGNVAYTSAETGNSNSWYFDKECSQHMTEDKRYIGLTFYYDRWKSYF